jgi:hypothetical protein
MNATLSHKTNFWNQALYLAFALPLGAMTLLLASMVVLASLVMILTPVGMALAPTWSVQLFYWKFESALDAWYLPVFGILLDAALVYAIKNLARFATSTVNLSLAK